MVDALLVALKDISVQLLPILGATALIFLCVLLKKLGKLADVLSKVIDTLEPTIKLVDKSIEKAQVPLDTVVKLSGTVDKVHDKTVDTVNKASVYVSENIGDIKEKLTEKVTEVKKSLKMEEVSENE